MLHANWFNSLRRLVRKPLKRFNGIRWLVLTH